LSRVTWRKPSAGIGDWLRNAFLAARYSLRAWYGRHMYRKLSDSIAGAYEREGSVLLADVNRYNALEAFPTLALRPLREAKSMEGRLVPASLPLYGVEENLSRGRVDAVRASLAALDQTWERDTLMDGLTRLGRLQQKRWDGAGLRETEGELFRVNPAALPPAGLALPVQLERGAGASWRDAWIASRLRGKLFRAGFQAARKSDYWLSISVQGRSISAKLGRAGQASAFCELERNYRRIRERDIAEFAQAFLVTAFRPGPWE
jgi:hypothetical protein